MNSTVRERVQGFLNKRSVPHSVVLCPKLGVTPASSSSQFSIGVSSTAAVGPKLEVWSPRLRLGAAPISNTATCSTSFFSCADANPRQTKNDVDQTHFAALIVRIPIYWIEDPR